MTLEIRPSEHTDCEQYVVYAGEVRLGVIAHVTGFDIAPWWSWGITHVRFEHGYGAAGSADSLEVALAGLASRWREWIAAAGLEEGEALDEVKSLRLRRRTDVEGEGYFVRVGDWQLGVIMREHSARSSWFIWSITDVYVAGDGWGQSHDRGDTLEDAKAGLARRWRQWLARAGLREVCA